MAVANMMFFFMAVESSRRQRLVSDKSRHTAVSGVAIAKFGGPTPWRGPRELYTWPRIPGKVTRGEGSEGLLEVAKMVGVQ